MNTDGNKRLIIDFDRTVFDTDSLYKDLFHLCELEGIQQGQLVHAHGLVPPNHLLFNFFLMVQQSKSVEEPRLAKIIRGLKDFVQQEGRKYVFPDVKLFLHAAREEGYQIEILTYGDLFFQLIKFLGSGLSAHSDCFTATQDLKWKHLTANNPRSLIFLDDNPKEIDGVKNLYPEVTTVEIKRPGTKYQFIRSLKADLTVDHLSWPLT